VVAPAVKISGRAASFCFREIETLLSGGSGQIYRRSFCHSEPARAVLRLDSAPHQSMFYRQPENCGRPAGARAAILFRPPVAMTPKIAERNKPLLPKRMTFGGCTRRLIGLLCLLVAGAGGFSNANAADMPAHRAADFLNSIGVVSSISRRGETLQNTIHAASYLGIRWIRAGYEGDIPLSDLIELHKQTGVRFSYGLGSGGADLTRLTAGARQLALAGALVALEGPNEPNNWGVTYQGQTGGRGGSWLAVARLQRDLFAAVKSDPVLRQYPVWTISESGAEADNVGLQFLTIPNGAGALLSDGTKYADAANVHNYIYHPNSPGLNDNKTWNAADPTSACKVDGLYVEFGLTWAHHYLGYPVEALPALPKVTTETGALIGGVITEDVHALNLLTMYLDQFKRGWSYTSVYLLRDRSDEAGNQQYGFYKPDYAPRKAAVCLHNLTTILADHDARFSLGKLNYSITNQPDTMHDLLLQKSTGKFELIVWNEKVSGTSQVNVNLGSACAALTIYDPTLGTSAIQTLSNVTSVPLTLGDHPVIIEL